MNWVCYQGRSLKSEAFKLLIIYIFLLYIIYRSDRVFNRSDHIKSVSALTGSDPYRIGFITDRIFFLTLHTHLLNLGSDRIGPDLWSIDKPSEF